jgi:hypothetical protein
VTVHVLLARIACSDAKSRLSGTMAEVQGNTSVLKRPCEDNLDPVKRQRVLADGENSGDINDIAGMLSKAEAITNDIYQVCEL